MPYSANPRKRRRNIIIFIAATVIAAAAAVGYPIAFCSAVQKEAIVYIGTNETPAALAARLAADGTIAFPERIQLAAKIFKRGQTFRPGRYRLQPGMNAATVVSMIKSGNQTPLNLTFNNIRTLPQLASVLGQQLQADSATFASVLTNDSIASSYGFLREEFIGMFIPNTYEVYWTVAPESFIERMNREYRRFWNEGRKARLEHTGLTQKQVATLASIVDEETARTDEMPIIAGVYLNRLRRGMPLQADPTVKFAIGDFSIKRILKGHLKFGSPYNTYLHTGLPPGPIRMPSIAAIDAVLNYAEHDYLYFCARPDFSGYHAFARTFAEHTRNARAYSAALDRLGIK